MRQHRRAEYTRFSRGACQLSAKVGRKHLGRFCFPPLKMLEVWRLVSLQTETVLGSGMKRDALRELNC